MKITESRLKKIIAEETKKLLKEKASPRDIKVAKTAAQLVKQVLARGAVGAAAGSWGGWVGAGIGAIVSILFWPDEAHAPGIPPLTGDQIEKIFEKTAEIHDMPIPEVKRITRETAGDEIPGPWREREPDIIYDPETGEPLVAPKDYDQGLTTRETCKYLLVQQEVSKHLPNARLAFLEGLRRLRNCDYSFVGAFLKALRNIGKGFNPGSDLPYLEYMIEDEKEKLREIQKNIEHLRDGECAFVQEQIPPHDNWFSWKDQYCRILKLIQASSFIQEYILHPQKDSRWSEESRCLSELNQFLAEEWQNKFCDHPTGSDEPESPRPPREPGSPTLEPKASE